MALWVAWRGPTDLIHAGAPPVNAKVKNKPVFERCRKKLFDLVVFLAAACRLFTTWTVSLSDVHRAQVFLQWYCQGLLRLKVPLQPNHHWSMHYEDMFRRFGPAYAWWVFAYERFNGLLSKVNLNRHPEKSPSTLMRFWIQMHRLYELVSQFHLFQSIWTLIK